MKKILFAIVALTVISLASCSKDKSENPAPYADDYRFFLKGKVAGLPVEYNAGENSYFLETSYSFSDSVVEMKGTLAPEGSMKNAFVLKLRSNNSMASPDRFQAHKNLRTGPMPFRDASGYRAEAGSYTLDLSFDTAVAYQSHQWTFPDGSTSTERHPVKTIELAEHEIYPVTLQTTGPASCSTEITHNINIQKDCDATFRINLVSGLQAELELQNTIGSIQKVTWILNGDSTVAASVNDVFTVANLAVANEITAVVEFAEGCAKVITKEINAGLTASCLTDFQYEKEKKRTHDPLQLGTVELIYYDENGTAYSSFYDDVSGDFELVSSAPFGENDQGQSTTRFFFETDVILKSSDGSSVELTDVFGSFAVAHP